MLPIILTLDVPMASCYCNSLNLLSCTPSCTLYVPETKVWSPIATEKKSNSYMILVYRSKVCQKLDYFVKIQLVTKEYQYIMGFFPLLTLSLSMLVLKFCMHIYMKKCFVQIFKYFDKLICIQLKTRGSWATSRTLHR